MDLYLLCLDKLNADNLQYKLNEEAAEMDKFNRKYDMMMNKKRMKELKIKKKNSTDSQQLKREIMDLKKNKYDIIDNYKMIEGIGRQCQSRLQISIHELSEELSRLTCKLRFHG